MIGLGSKPWHIRTQVDNLELIRKPSDAFAEHLVRTVSKQAQPGFRRGLYNLSENPLTPAHRPSIDGLLNKRTRVFGYDQSKPGAALTRRGSIEDLLADAVGGATRGLSGSIRRIVLSQPEKGASASSRKLGVRPVVVRGRPEWQFEWQRGAQAIHENLDGLAAQARLCEAASEFRQILVRTAEGETQGRRPKGREWAWSTRAAEVVDAGKLRSPTTRGGRT